MGTRLIATAAVALALASPVAAGLPRGGTLVPGRSLGGVRLGESSRDVRAALGTFYGHCTGCARSTWYFTYGPFDKHGLAVELTRGKVSAVYTLWQPGGWVTAAGLRLGASQLTLHKKVGFLCTIACQDYDALVADSARARTAYYVVQGSLWGFGLFRRGATPCR